MIRRTLTALLAITASIAVPATPALAATDATRTPATPAHTISQPSNAAGGFWTGHESVSFRNASAVPLTEVYLRLWDNAHGTCGTLPIKVGNVTGGTAGALEVACTALKITLPAPLAQGATGSGGFDVSITVTAGIDRFGHDGGYYFIGNAIPVLAVRDAAGWHLDPYTDNGESFYALASDYTVTLDHPGSISVPATGTSTDTAGASGRTVTRAVGTKVREFAWAAGPFAKTSGT